MLFARLHVQALVEALQRLARQPFATAASLLVLGVAIALPVVAAIVLQSANAMSASLDTEPHVNVYLSLDAVEEDVKRIERALKGTPGVGGVRFVSRNQALAELKATTHLADVLSTLERNPLPHAFTVRMDGADPEGVRRARSTWAQLPKVDQVVADLDWAERLGRWVVFGNRLVVGFGILLGLAVLFIVGHLIRLQVLSQRAVIELSQLIGATVADVRRPFLYLGALQGLAGGLAALGMAASVGWWLNLELQALTPQFASDLKILFLPDLLAGSVVAAAALLGVLGAYLAVGREVRRFAADR